MGRTIKNLISSAIDCSKWTAVFFFSSSKVKATDSARVLKL